MVTSMSLKHICTACKKDISNTRIYPGYLCQGCYKYFLSGGRVYELPKLGVLAKDDRGYVICHICGRSYKRLGSHIRESHNMKISEYKEKFGLCNATKTTEANYSNKMRTNAILNHMPERLMELGKNTRIKKGEKDKRKGKPVREQERLIAKERFAKHRE